MASDTATIRPLWAPHPYRAGFCITDDTDAATLERVRAVYDLLDALGLRASKTVWAFAPEEPCGIPGLPDSIQRGITLEDPAYADYCARLAERGFEICPHGASAGNNRRARTAAALELIERRYGPAGTFICHAKNAENPYWHEKVAPRGPAQWALRFASRYRCSGEDPESPYFWGDLCLEKVRHIRLFRTRDPNTLARNPSMPYFDPEKPYVPGWFAATKRSFHDCTSAEALRRLGEAGGLCVLYQYMHRYADAAGHAVDPAFRADAERLASAGDVWKETTSRIMDRLRLIQGVFLARHGGRVWVMNANDREVTGLRIAGPVEPEALGRGAGRERPGGEGAGRAPAGGGRAGTGGTDAGRERAHVSRVGGALVIERLAAGAALSLGAPRGAAIAPRHEVRLDPRGRGRRDFGAGTIRVNLGEAAWTEGATTLVPGTFAVAFRPGLERLRPFSIARTSECYRLLGGQLAIIGREILFKGRSLDSRKFLGAESIELEDHSKW